MHQTLADALAGRGYDTLTPVQQAVTADGLEGADLLVSAQTGSGKTAGFGLAIAPALLDEEGRVPGPAAAPLALIVAPTRELAFQVMRELDWLYGKTGARLASCVGGMDMRGERRALERGAHIVVGTPGRLRDHIQRGSLQLDALRAVVLDEADEMLDLGFREDLEFMLAEAPEDRRTLMFSATVSKPIAALAARYQRDAQRIVAGSTDAQHADIEYQALRVAPRDAANAVINLLRFHDAQNAIVFANTRAEVARLTARLGNRGFQVVQLSGELSQTERSHALQAMRDGRARVCVATDVAARGIDLPNLDLVIHADLPSNTEALLHRSGRTGRAGRKGISVLIVPGKAEKAARRLLKWAKIEASWGEPPSAAEVQARDEERLLHGPVWDQEPSEDEASFAARLLALHSPEHIAAAYLRLYQERQSAPEELTAPDAAPAAPRAPRDHASFGPGVWFALSAGRNQRAEPRWLLPLICRAGKLERGDIGAIRIGQDASYVELAEAAVPGFLDALGGRDTLEDGITLTPMAGPPDAALLSRPASPRKGPGKPSHGAGAMGKGPKRPHRGQGPKPRQDAGPEVSSAPQAPEKAAAPAKPPRKKTSEPAERKDPKPAPKRATKPVWKDGPKSAAPKGTRPGAADSSKRMGPPKGAAKPGGGKPRKPGGKPPAHKPRGKPQGKAFRPGGSEPPRRKRGS